MFSIIYIFSGVNVYILCRDVCVHIGLRCFYLYGVEMFVHFAVTRSQANRRVDKAIDGLSLETTADEGGRRRRKPRRFTAGDAYTSDSDSDSDDGVVKFQPRKKRRSKVRAEEAPGLSKPSLPTPPHLSSAVIMRHIFNIVTTTSTSIYTHLLEPYIHIKYPE